VLVGIAAATAHGRFRHIWTVLMGGHITSSNIGGHCTFRTQCDILAVAGGDAGPPNKSICGFPLAGEKLVRLIYLDESGISNPAHEPFLVVAGAMVDADKALGRVERYLSALVATQIPPEMQKDFVFHATELWSGSKRFGDRDRWSFEKRLAILQRLSEIPQKFDIKISFGFIDRTKPVSPDGRSLVDLNLGFTPYIEEFCTAFVMCGMFIEGTMRHLANDEVALLIAEDTDKIKRFVKSSQAMLKSPRYKMPATNISEEINFFPLKHIKDTIHFAAKSESVCLQIADLCAFLIKRRLMRRSQSDYLFDLIEPQLVWRPQEIK
jgi:hypothetical protein